jgi:hypothetical protein
MKSKIGKSKIGILFIFIALALIGGYFYYNATHIKTITEHSTPADISESESGTGLSVRFIDSNGNEIEIPSWFSTTQDTNNYAIAKSPAPASCTTTSNCAGYATNPNIMCWSGKCVLGNIAGVYLDYSIQNTGSSGVIFNNVGVYSASPTLLNSYVNKTIINGLASGQTASFKMASAIPVSSFVGTNVTFVVNASGVSNYNNQTYTVSDSFTLGFYADPTSSLSISLVKVV